MTSEPEHFLGFVQLLLDQAVLTASDVNEALEPLGGSRGVLDDGFYIFGYECLAWSVNKKLSIERIKEFAGRNAQILLEHKDARYFFVDALVQIEHISSQGLADLITFMPESYQVYLRRKYLGEALEITFFEMEDFFEEIPVDRLRELLLKTALSFVPPTQFPAEIVGTVMCDDTGISVDLDALRAFSLRMADTIPSTPQSGYGFALATTIGTAHCIQEEEEYVRDEDMFGVLAGLEELGFARQDVYRKCQQIAKEMNLIKSPKVP